MNRKEINITAEYARQKLGNQATKFSDEELENILRVLRRICNRVIDQIVDYGNKN